MSSFKSSLENNPPPNPRKEWDKNLIAVAVIGAIGAIVAAFVGGALGGHAVGLGPGPSATVTKTVLITPGQSRSAQPVEKTSTFPPQAGYAFRWQQSIVIGVNGVVFQQAEPVAAGNSNLDLDYFGDPGNGWDGNDNDIFNPWLPAGIPTPMDCTGNGSGHKAFGTVAEVGNRYCFVNNQSQNGPIVVSLVVIRIQDGNVTLDAWAWAPES